MKKGKTLTAFGVLQKGTGDVKSVYLSQMNASKYAYNYNKCALRAQTD